MNQVGGFMLECLPNELVMLSFDSKTKLIFERMLNHGLESVKDKMQIEVDVPEINVTNIISARISLENNKLEINPKIIATVNNRRTEFVLDSSSIEKFSDLVNASEAPIDQRPYLDHLKQICKESFTRTATKEYVKRQKDTSGLACEFTTCRIKFTKNSDGTYSGQVISPFRMRCYDEATNKSIDTEDQKNSEIARFNASLDYISSLADAINLKKDVYKEFMHMVQQGSRDKQPIIVKFDEDQPIIKNDTNVIVVNKYQGIIESYDSNSKSYTVIVNGKTIKTTIDKLDPLETGRAILNSPNLTLTLPETHYRDQKINLIALKVRI